MQWKEVVTTGVVIVLSTSIGLFLCEAGARMMLNSADYLAPKMVRDEVLGITIQPGSSGFDEWGFRNNRVPSTVNVLAVGDSHTYGNTARMDDAWPSVVARETHSEVYNLGLGGYGPNQYYHLMVTKGLKLHPKWVICGLYMGDDFENAFSVTYGFPYWAALRKGKWDNVNPDIWNPDPPVWGAEIRNWLSMNSMVYRIVFHGPIVARIIEKVRFKWVATGSDPYTTSLIIEDENIREAFRPLGVAESLNPASEPIQEGMRITFHLLKEMHQACMEQGCKFLVVIIPTKEMVFSDQIERTTGLHLREALNRVILNERTARRELIGFLESAGIPHLDTLSALKKSVGNRLYAQTTRDMHPGKNGYRVIGEVVANYLKNQPSDP